MLFRKSGRRTLIWVMGFLAIFLASLLGSPPAVHSAFSDLSPDAPDHPFVKYLQGQNLLAGFPDGSFRPQHSITRAEMAALLVRAEGLTEHSLAQPTFSDVAPEHWAYEAVETAVVAGLVRGYPDNTFRPGAQVTRAETAALLLRLSKEPLPGIAIPTWVQDVDPDHWAAAPMAASLDAGILTLSDPHAFAPGVPATRSQVARGLAVTLNLDPDRLEVSLVGLLVPLEGDVRLVEREHISQKITEPTTCAAGATIITGPQSRAEVQFPDGSGLFIAENTELSIMGARGQATIMQDGSPGAVVEFLDLDLKKGRLFGALASTYHFDYVGSTREEIVLSAFQDITQMRTEIPTIATVQAQPDNKELPWWKKPFAPKQRVQVNMPWGVAAVRGTFWISEVNPERHVTNVLDGRVDVTAAEVTRSVPRGHSSYIYGPDLSPTPPTPMTTEERELWRAVQAWVLERAAAMARSFPLINPQGLSDPLVDSDPDQEPLGTSDSLLERIKKAFDELIGDTPAPAPRKGGGGRTTSPPASTEPTEPVSEFVIALAEGGHKTSGVPFDMNITGARDTDGRTLTGDIIVTVTSSNEEVEVHNTAVLFDDGAATVEITLNHLGNHTLTVRVDGVTTDQTLVVNVVVAELGPPEDQSEFAVALAVPGYKTSDVPFNLNITGARGADGSTLTGDINVTVTSSNEEVPVVHNSAVPFDAGAATAEITLIHLGTHTLTVNVAEVTEDQTLTLTVGSEPSELREIAVLDPATADWDIHIVGDYAYTTRFMEGLGVIDISDPEYPEQVGSFSHSWLNGLHIQGNRAYVAAQNDGLDILDVSDPVNPTRVNTIPLGGWNASDVYVSGSYAYVANTRGGLEIISIDSEENVATLLSMDYYVNAVTVGDAVYAYVTTWDLEADREELRVVDISNPSSPSPLGAVVLPSRAFKVFAAGNFVYVGTMNDGLRVVDVSNPLAPVVVGSFATLTNDVRGLYVLGSYAFVTDLGGALHQLDISNPSAPIEVSRIEGWVSPRGVWVAGNHVYVVDARKLRVVETLP